MTVAADLAETSYDAGGASYPPPIGEWTACDEPHEDDWWV